MACSLCESMRPVVRRVFLAAWRTQKCEIVRAARAARAHAVPRQRGEAANAGSNGLKTNIWYYQYYQY